MWLLTYIYRLSSLILLGWFTSYIILKLSFYFWLLYKTRHWHAGWAGEVELTISSLFYLLLKSPILSEIWNSDFTSRLLTPSRQISFLGEMKGSIIPLDNIFLSSPTPPFLPLTQSLPPSYHYLIPYFPPSFLPLTHSLPPRYLPEFPSKKTYHFRYVVCLPLQKHVLQESKTELFKQCEVDKVLKNMIFEYPR